MPQNPESDTRDRLLLAATEHVAASPGEELSLRAVCKAAGVQTPTLYHYFGSRAGLIDAIVERGFSLYLAEKEAHESSGDPIQDIRAGWDAHVEFGLANPGLYTLMYGQIKPGYSPSSSARPTEVLRELTASAEKQHRLAVPADVAAAHILASNVGVTLRLITLGAPDPELSAMIREATIAAITQTEGSSSSAVLSKVVETAAAHTDVLGATETKLLLEWLHRLKDATADDDPQV